MLTQRREELLKLLVGEYISTAIPVASQAIVKKHQLGISPATVRNEMAGLEEEGYITRPHPSAGGVPSNKGYRFYVSTLSDLIEPPQDFQYTIRYQFTKTAKDLDHWTRLAATALAQLINNVAIVTYPRWRQVRLRRIDLVCIQEFLALLILVLQETKIRKQLVALTEPVSDEDLQHTANKLNHTLSGLTRTEILSKSLEFTPLERHIADVTLDIMRQEEEALHSEHYVEGLRHLLSQPELSEAERARAILEVLEEGNILDTILAEAPERGKVKVVIGEENRESFLRPFSVVLCQYGLPDGGLGFISAIGPTRMQYGDTMAGVRFISSLMTELMIQISD